MKEAIEILKRKIVEQEKKLPEIEERIKKYMKEINYANDHIKTIMAKQKGLEEAIKVLEKVKQ